MLFTAPKHKIDLMTLFKPLAFTIVVEFPFRLALQSLPLAPSVASLCLDFFARPLICANSNYVERLSAVSVQTRMLLPLEDEINARPINSTLPSSLPSPPPSGFAMPTLTLLSFHASALPSSPDDTTWLYDNSGPSVFNFRVGKKMRFPIADVVGFMLRPRRYLAACASLCLTVNPVANNYVFPSLTERLAHLLGCTHRFSFSNNILRDRKWDGSD